MTRLDDIQHFYDLVGQLADRIGGPRTLASFNSRDWPRRGVYFFFEPGEKRSDSGDGLRIVRVGTHALKTGSRSTVGGRLRQHRGTDKSGGGNHRGSIFRLLVGLAMIKRDPGVGIETWSQQSSAGRAIRDAEMDLERLVTERIGLMQVVALPIDDDPGPDSLRGYIERNAIALLSNYRRPILDQPSPVWLGADCPRERVQQSGLWNNNHVDEQHDPAFLDLMCQILDPPLSI